MDLSNIMSNLIDKSLLNTAMQQIKARYADKDSVSAIETSLNTHTSNSTVHITADERTKWNDACEVKSYIRVKSSTSGSSKVFRLTIDDDGILTGVEED